MAGRLTLSRKLCIYKMKSSWNYVKLVLWSATDIPSRCCPQILRSSLHVQCWINFSLDSIPSIFDLRSLFIMKVNSVAMTNFWKPHRLLQAKSCIRVYAESPTEINGKHAAASPGGPNLPSFSSVLPPCLLSILRTVVTASEQSTHYFSDFFLLVHFTWRQNFLVLGPQINFSSTNVYDIHKWVEWRHWKNFLSLQMKLELEAEKIIKGNETWFKEKRVWVRMPTGTQST